MVFVRYADLGREGPWYPGSNGTDALFRGKTSLRTRPRFALKSATTMKTAQSQQVIVACPSRKQLHAVYPLDNSVDAPVVLCTTRKSQSIYRHRQRSHADYQHTSICNLPPAVLSCKPPPLLPNRWSRSRKRSPSRHTMPLPHLRYPQAKRQTQQCTPPPPRNPRPPSPQKLNYCNRCRLLLGSLGNRQSPQAHHSCRGQRNAHVAGRRETRPNPSRFGRRRRAGSPAPAPGLLVGDVRQGEAPDHAGVLPEGGRGDVVVHGVRRHGRVVDVAVQQLPRPLPHL